MQEGNKSLDVLQKCAIWMGTFTLSPVSYMTVDFKKLVCDLFHVVESESNKRKTRLSE